MFYGIILKGFFKMATGINLVNAMSKSSVAQPIQPIASVTVGDVQTDVSTDNKKIVQGKNFIEKFLDKMTQKRIEKLEKISPELRTEEENAEILANQTAASALNCMV